MTDAADLAHLLAVLRGEHLAIGVDDVARITRVLHQTQDWVRERRVRALRTLVARSPVERERFDHVAPLLLAASGEPGPGEPPPAEPPAEPSDAGASPSHPAAWIGRALASVAQRGARLADPSWAHRAARWRRATWRGALGSVAPRPAPPVDRSAGSRAPASPRAAPLPEDEPPTSRTPRGRSMAWIGGAIAGATIAAVVVALLWPVPRPLPSSGGSGASGAEPRPAPETDRPGPAPSRPGEVEPPAAEPLRPSGALRGLALACGAVSLVLAAWSLRARRSRRRSDAAIASLARSSGRRTVGVAVERPAIQPIDRRTIAELAHVIAAPAASERETAFDAGATIDATARNAGRLTLCFAREPEQPALIVVEDVARSMERWPAHANQLARALEAHGQPVARRYIAGDPLELSERRTLGGPGQRLEDVTAGSRVVVVSDAAHFDRASTRTPRHSEALGGVIWLQPRPDELWRSGARWLDGCAAVRTLGAVPGSLVQPVELAPPWHPPRPRSDADETADAWRSALGAEAYLALAATALLDLAASWSALLVWALISDGVIGPPWRLFERIWDLPEFAVLPGGRISLAPALRDRLLADARRERRELVERVAAWIDARLAGAIAAAGDGSLGAAVGEVYRDRVARAAGLDDSGARIRELAQRGLAAVAAAHVGSDERELWNLRDPRTALAARVRGPLLGLAVLATSGFALASELAPARPPPGELVAARTADASIDALADSPIDAPIDAPPDARAGDAERGAQVAERAGCLGCHGGDRASRDRLGPAFAGMWGSAVPQDGPRQDRSAQPKVDEAYVRDKLLYPRQTHHAGYPLVHASYDTLDEAAVADLVAYLRSLAADAPVDVEITGTATIDRDTVIRGRRVTFADGAKRRVRHGVTLRIEAEVIVVAGTAEIDGTGDRGARGVNAVTPGDEVVRDQDGFERARMRCSTRRPDGGAGGNGGRGATIVLAADRIDDRGLIVRVDGGRGGPGGRAAAGKRITWEGVAPDAGTAAPGGGTLPPRFLRAPGDSPGAPARSSSPVPASKGPRPPSKGSGKGGVVDLMFPMEIGSEKPSTAGGGEKSAPLRKRAPRRRKPQDDRPDPEPRPRDRALDAPEPRAPRTLDAFRCPAGVDGSAGQPGPSGSLTKSPRSGAGNKD